MPQPCRDPLTKPLSRRPSVEEWLPVWRTYKATGDRRLRDRLVFTYAPVVKYLAYGKAKELPARCEIGDLVAAGLEALIASIDRYDPDRGATLEQFVWTRIHGAIIDELRRHDWAPRSVRRWERDIAEARDRFTANHGRVPSRRELADALGITVDDLRRHQHDVAASTVTSLNSVVLADDDSSVERIELLADDEPRSDPGRASVLEDGKRRFREAFEALPARDRQVAVLLYVKNLTLREIGDVLGVSESRVSQIHSSLKRRLREQLARHDELFYELT